MTHEPAEFIREERRTTSGVAIWRCPVCRKALPGVTQPKPCTGRQPVAIDGPPLDCVHRLDKIAQIPCGNCPENPERLRSVYLCKFGGFRPCVLHPVGTTDAQRVRGMLPVACSTCADRQPKPKE